MDLVDLLGYLAFLAFPLAMLYAGASDLLGRCGAHAISLGAHLGERTLQPLLGREQQREVVSGVGRGHPALGVAASVPRRGAPGAARTRSACARRDLRGRACGHQPSRATTMPVSAIEPPAALSPHASDHRPRRSPAPARASETIVTIEAMVATS